MAIFIGVFIVALVLFMVFAMALAEWADKDPSDLFAAWFGRREAGAAAAGAALPAAQAEPMASAPAVTTTGKSPAAQPSPRAKARRAKTAGRTKTATTRKKS